MTNTADHAALAPPLRIAVWHDLPSGGAKRALHDHVRGLVSRGHRVEAWCPPTANRSYLPLEALIDEHVMPLDVSALPPLREIDRDGPATVARNLAAMDAHCQAVAAAMGTDHDVVLATSSQLHAVAPLGRYVRAPSVVYLQEPNRVLYEATFRPHPAAGMTPRLAWLERAPVARAAACLARAAHDDIRSYDRVLVNSRFSRENVLRAYGVSAHVCYLGVDPDRFYPAPNPSRDYVVGVGAFVAEKNIELVIDALAQIQPTPPPLVWVGNHVYSDAYVAELARRARCRKVPFTAHTLVNDDELIALVAGARLMAYGPRLEPFGYAPLEANACGVPVVAGAEGGVRETILDGYNGLLVEPEPNAMGTAIAQLWHDDDRARAMGSNGRKRTLASWTLRDAVDRLERHLMVVALGADPGIEI